MDAAPAAPAPEAPPAEPAPAPEAPPAEPAPPVAEAKDTVEKDEEGNVKSWKHEGDWKKDTEKKDPRGKVTNSSGKALKKSIALAKKAGATAETIIRIAGKEMTLGEAITKAGMKVEDVFGNKADELIEFVKSMYNANEGNFPKGEEGVKIACEKKFGDNAGPIAEKVIAKLSSLGEMNRMKQLAGLAR